MNHNLNREEIRNNRDKVEAPDRDMQNIVQQEARMSQELQLKYAKLIAADCTGHRQHTIK